MTDPLVEIQRLDQWLFHARIFKSRALARRFCEAGKIRINRRRTHKAHQPLRPGDVLSFALDERVRVLRVRVLRVRVLRVRTLGARRGPAGEARQLYDDIADEEPAAASWPARKLSPPS